MGLFHRLASLNATERRLLARALLWIVSARVGLRVFPYRTLLGLLDRASRRASLGTPCSPEKVRWALVAAASRLPGTRCLAWAIACHNLLRQAGFDSELRIGVAKSPGERLRAHAWVECDGGSLSWGDDERLYAPLTSVLGGDS